MKKKRSEGDCIKKKYKMKRIEYHLNRIGRWLFTVFTKVQYARAMLTYFIYFLKNFSFYNVLLLLQN